MSGRPTAELLAEAHEVIQKDDFYGDDFNFSHHRDLISGLADRLAELETSETKAMEMLGAMAIKIDALLPLCTTCGGKGMVARNFSDTPCPDCSDGQTLGTGKVSIEQLVAEHNALWNDDSWRELTTFDAAAHAVIYALRHVKVDR